MKFREVSLTALLSVYSLRSVDIPALVLALVGRHDVLVPVQQPVVPVTLLIDSDQTCPISITITMENLGKSYFISSQPP